MKSLIEKLLGKKEKNTVDTTPTQTERFSTEFKTRDNSYALGITTIDNGKGYWNSSHVNIYATSPVSSHPHGIVRKVGEYVRTYHDKPERTFKVFTRKGKDYALISDSYVRAAVMDLETGKIIAEEPKDSCGFCPVEFYIPPFEVYRQRFKPEIQAKFDRGEHVETLTERRIADGQDPNANWMVKGDDRYPTDFYEFYEDFIDPEYAFVSGCVWGDDWSWKIQVYDLTKIEEGIIKREEKFGYVVLPENVSLKDAVVQSLEEDERDHSIVYHRIRLAIQHEYNMLDNANLVIY